MVSKRFSLLRTTCCLVAALLYMVTPVSAHEGEDHSGDSKAKRGKKTKVTGYIDILQADDFANGKSLLHYYLKAEKGRKKFRIYFKEPPPGTMKSGDKIAVNARISSDGNKLYVPAQEDGGNTTIVASGEAAAVSGARKLLLMRVTMNDGSPSCSTTSIANLMWNNSQNINGLFQSSSYGALWFPSDNNNDGAPDVVDVAIPYNASGSCDYYSWASAAESEAAKKGYNISNYQHRGLVLPGNTGCGWAGLGNLGGSSARIWIEGSYCGTADIYAHELGHNLSMHHAAQVGAGEYSDKSCIMGYGGVGMRHFNAPHADQMGWLPSYEIALAGGGGSQTFTLSALETIPEDDGKPKVVKILKADTGDTYYISYRRRSGNYSSGLGSSYDARTNIHYYRGGASFTYLVGTLGDGQSLVDSANGITFSQVSHNDADLTAQVTLSYVCSAGTPAISLSPATNSTSTPGAPLSYTVTVKNNDAPSCGSSTFSLSSSVPSGWSASFASSTMSLGAGASGSTTLTIAPPATVGDGQYSFSLQVSAAGHSSATGSGTYVLDGAAPSVPSNLSASTQTSKKRTNVSLSWSAANDSGSGIAGYDILRNGAVIGQTSGTGTSYTDSNVASGTHSYNVRARDAAGNTSALSNTAQVTVGSTKGGGGGNGGGGPKGRSK
ncbi:MAG: hypothetical protein J5J00_10935 [Deltaproteobacteria bacterium]|nr:hypothetical protein [Deltaproteobacteria bacterium]